MFDFLMLNSDLVKTSGEINPNTIDSSQNIKGYYTEPGTGYQYLFLQIVSTFSAQIIILNTTGESKIAYRIKLSNGVPFGEAVWTWIANK